MSQDFRSSHWYRVAQVRPRLAPELRVQRQVWRGTPWYVLFDPLNQRTQRLTPQAWFLVARMDGTQSMDQLFAAAQAEFGEKAPPQDELIQLLAQLHDADALASDVLPDLEDLSRRRRQKQRQQWKQRLANPIALRFRLWDPDAFLVRTLPAVRWLLGPAGALLWLAICVPAAVLAWMNWGAISGNASDSLLSAGSLLTMALVYPFVKAIHELAHAYAARHGGAEVHDLGVMLLVFFPVPYVDASGTAAFPRHAERARVAAIGMLAELLLASLAVFVWLAVEPGWVRSLAFSVMVLGGLSTVLFNGNPLLRFDGYYVLCDALQIANLGPRANRHWQYLIKRHAFGLEHAQAPEATPGERRWFLAYAPASLAYRLFITVGIALFLGQEYLYLGLAVGLWGLATQFVWPLLKGAHWVVMGTDLVGRRGRPVMVTAGTLAVVALLVGAVPAPLRTYSQGVVWPGEQAQLRAGESGFVTDLALRPGDRVQPGMRVAMLHNDELQAQLDEAQARTAEFRARYLSALAQSRDGAEPGKARVETAVGQDALQQAEDALAHAEAKAQELRVVAQRAGRLELPMASDLPGRFLRKGEPIGHVITGDAPTVRVVVTQDDVDLVRAQLRAVEVRLAGDLGRIWPARLVREVPGGDAELPSGALALDHGGTIVTDPRAGEDGPRALNRVFQFDLELPPEAAAAHVGERAHVRFVHRYEPLGQQAWRRLRQLLLSRLAL